MYSTNHVALFAFEHRLIPKLLDGDKQPHSVADLFDPHLREDLLVELQKVVAVDMVCWVRVRHHLRAVNIRTETTVPLNRPSYCPHLTLRSHSTTFVSSQDLHPPSSVHAQPKTRKCHAHLTESSSSKESENTDPVGLVRREELFEEGTVVVLCEDAEWYEEEGWEDGPPRGAWYGFEASMATDDLDSQEEGENMIMKDISVLAPFANRLVTQRPDTAGSGGVRNCRREAAAAPLKGRDCDRYYATERRGQRNKKITRRAAASRISLRD